jgi:hypothetical protein
LSYCPRNVPANEAGYCTSDTVNYGAVCQIKFNSNLRLPARVKNWNPLFIVPEDYLEVHKTYPFFSGLTERKFAFIGGGMLDKSFFFTTYTFTLNFDQKGHHQSQTLIQTRQIAFFTEDVDTNKIPGDYSNFFPCAYI